MPGARLKRMRLRTVGSWNDFRTDRTGLADPHVGRGSRRVARTLILGRGFGGLAVAHELRRLAGDDGLALLALGTRDPNDIVYYPRSGKVSLRGVGVRFRVDALDYWDGEPG